MVRGGVGGAGAAPLRQTTMRAAAQASDATRTRRQGSWQAMARLEGEESSQASGLGDHSAFRSRQSVKGKHLPIASVSGDRGEDDEVRRGRYGAGEEMEKSMDLRCLDLTRDVSVSQPD
ncbi:hypothetical protein G7Z17_g11195 [Cylindrodendrum hubeiense]|uniref:Uncharacterized protein n=1 Tax=Cylindrodendrum hubeiense TaxID=595255 RepID=A0A9P5H004_9HYPO|nr:hypothetical protein G7Z17_g11195 [Cylindrodendrum hubeiense]